MHTQDGNLKASALVVYSSVVSVVTVGGEQVRELTQRLQTEMEIFLSRRKFVFVKVKVRLCCSINV